MKKIILTKDEAEEVKQLVSAGKYSSCALLGYGELPVDARIFGIRVEVAK